MPITKTFTTKEVANLCRVSDATVKRWEDAGLIKSERTSGGHRRFRAEEIARFQREQGLGQKLSHGDESVFTASVRRTENSGRNDFSLFDALIAGIEEKAADILINAHLHGRPLAEIFDDLLCSPMHKIGRLWFEGELSIAQEHLATRTAHNALYKLRSRLPVPAPVGKLAMCCAFEGEFHELPTHLIQIIVENEGWEVLNFGANTPLFALREEVSKHKPEMVCISATVMNNLERLAHDFRAFREETEKLKIPIVLGGRAFEDECVRKRFPAEMYARSFAEVTEFIRSATRL